MFPVEFEFTVPREWWLSSNDRYHRMDVARRTRALREFAFMVGRERGRAIDRPVVARCYVSLPTRRRFDPPNSWPTFKALIDGLVDAGVLVDDSAFFIREHSFIELPAKRVKGAFYTRIVFDIYGGGE